MFILAGGHLTQKIIMKYYRNPRTNIIFFIVAAVIMIVVVIMIHCRKY